MSAAAQITSTILVVEDDPDSREILCRLLRAARHVAVGCANATEAIRTLAGQQFDRAILDLMLPDRPGVDVLRFIRRRNLPTQVAILSGYHDPEAFPGLAELAPDVIFRKPVNVVALNRWLGESPQGT